MPDLTLILVLVGIAVAVGGVVLFMRSKGTDRPAAPVEPAAGPSKAEIALQVALRQAIDRLHASTPIAAEKPAPAPVPAVPGGLPRTDPQTAPTAATWQEPPSPWPIDARYLSAEQIAALTPDGQRRATLWSQMWTTAARNGNADPAANLAGALGMYHAAFCTIDELNQPLPPIWQAIYAAYGVPAPVIDTRPWTGSPSPPRPSDAAYDVRLQT